MSVALLFYTDDQTKGINLKLFRGKKKKALVFVDFEYMQISFKKRYGIQPPIIDWYRSLTAVYDVSALYVFADFSNPAMKNNLPVLRQITDNIIETQNTSSRHKKDFTDFFMLDKIYQKAYQKHKASVFVLFTGDGHFGAVSRFLINHCKKEVVIYGIDGNISNQLRTQVTKVLLYPDRERLVELYIPYLAQAIRSLMTQNSAAHLTVSRITDAACNDKHLEPEVTDAAIQKMFELGYLSYSEQWVSARKRTRVLTCDFDRIHAEKI